MNYFSQLVSIRFRVRGGSRHELVKEAVASGKVSIRFEVRGGSRPDQFAVPCDDCNFVSIRFRVRGGSRPGRVTEKASTVVAFQSASGFAVVPDPPSKRKDYAMWFQSALRFAVVSDLLFAVFGFVMILASVSIRFKVRGGFRLSLLGVGFVAWYVSIRFKVRGGFRPYVILSGIAYVLPVSIRFKVRGGFRPEPRIRTLG